ncbi:MAG: sigma-70 family RNA polymerase sigma factor [Chloroflexi bacterium]|nr:sigma-70 family RNA polymerase sigma factor [Chloroflexota bacterium]
MLLGKPREDAGQKRAAVAALYETHFERVARYIAVRIGDISEAEDLASEVFVRALRSVADYKESGAPMEAWVFRIAHNIAVDHLRAKGRRPAAVPLDAVPSAANIGGDPTESLERQEEVQRLHEGIRELSEAQRQVLALRLGSEMTAEQVAQVLGKKPGAVREMQSAAIKKLRELLRERHKS